MASSCCFRQADGVQAGHRRIKFGVRKIVIASSETWRRLKGTNHLPKIVAGVRFKDGIEVLEVPENHTA